MAASEAAWSEFVNSTGYVTVAERKPDWEELTKQLPPGTILPTSRPSRPNRKIKYNQALGAFVLHELEPDVNAFDTHSRRRGPRFPRSARSLTTPPLDRYVLRNLSKIRVDFILEGRADAMRHSRVDF